MPHFDMTADNAVLLRRACCNEHLARRPPRIRVFRRQCRGNGLPIPKIVRSLRSLPRHSQVKQHSSDSLSRDNGLGPSTWLYTRKKSQRLCDAASVYPELLTLTRRSQYRGQGRRETRWRRCAQILSAPREWGGGGRDGGGGGGLRGAPDTGWLSEWCRRIGGGSETSRNWNCSNCLYWTRPFSAPHRLCSYCLDRKPVFPCHAIKHKVVFNSATDDVVTYIHTVWFWCMSVTVNQKQPRGADRVKAFGWVDYRLLVHLLFSRQQISGGKKTRQAEKEVKNNIRKWTGPKFAKFQRVAKNREGKWLWSHLWCPNDHCS